MTGHPSALVMADMRSMASPLVAVLLITAASLAVASVNGLGDAPKTVLFALIAMIGGPIVTNSVFLRDDRSGWPAFLVASGISRRTLVATRFASAVAIVTLAYTAVAGACIAVAGDMTDAPAKIVAVAAISAMMTACSSYYNMSVGSRAHRSGIGTEVRSRGDALGSMGLTCAALFMSFLVASGSLRTGVDGVPAVFAVAVLLCLGIVAAAYYLSARVMGGADL